MENNCCIARAEPFLYEGVTTIFDEFCHEYHPDILCAGKKEFSCLYTMEKQSLITVFVSLAFWLLIYVVSKVGNLLDGEVQASEFDVKFRRENCHAKVPVYNQRLEGYTSNPFNLTTSSSRTRPSILLNVKEIGNPASITQSRTKKNNQRNARATVSRDTSVSLT